MENRTNSIALFGYYSLQAYKDIANIQHCLSAVDNLEVTKQPILTRCSCDGTCMLIM